MKKRFLLLIPSLFGILLAGCGGDDKTSDNSQDDKVEPIGGGADPGQHTAKYTVTFKDENGNNLESKEWDKNSIPSYNYAGPNDTEEWDYSFSGWSLSQNGEMVALSPVTQDITYFAIISKTKCSYLITFNDENGVLVSSSSFEYGAQPSCAYVGPNDTDEWDYTFNGWSLTQGGEVLSALPAVTGAATYYASVSSTKKQYTITFNSKGGSAVDPITVDYGTEITPPEKPKKSGYKFTGWSLNEDGTSQVSFPYTVTCNRTFYGNWNEKINLKPYFEELMTCLKKNEIRKYIPETMLPEYTANHLTSYDVDYDFNSFTNVSDIHYGGFGEQWQMTVDALLSLDKFYTVFATLEPVISATVAIYNNYLDENVEDSAVLDLDEENYEGRIAISWYGDQPIMLYKLKMKTSVFVPFFGSVTPEIEFSYSYLHQHDQLWISFNGNNQMCWFNHYGNGILATDYAYKIGTDSVYKTSELLIEHGGYNLEKKTGTIIEKIKHDGEDVIKKAAYFAVDDEYVSVVGNKASGLPGFSGYINELYDVTTGKLLGYKVRETFTKWGFEKTYNTLWFNLPDILNINSVKAVANGSIDPHENHHDIYLNGSSEKFVPKKNKVVLVETSRRYDVELRKQFFYGIEAGKVVEFETEIPMMFIQDNGTESGETNYSTFQSDIFSTNGINASVTLASKHLERIRSDYLTLIDYFINNVEK